MADIARTIDDLSQSFYTLNDRLTKHMESEERGHLSKVPTQLAELIVEVKGINRRLDIVNHRLDKHGEKINALELFSAEYKGTARAAGWIAGIIAGIASSMVVSVILYSLGLKK